MKENIPELEDVHFSERTHQVPIAMKKLEPQQDPQGLTVMETEEKILTAERKTECESEVKMMSFIAVVLQTRRTMPSKA